MKEKSSFFFEILDVAAGLSSEDRIEYIEKKCQGDATMLAELKTRLYQLDSDRVALLDKDLVTYASSLLDFGPFKKGDVVGRYTILEEIGRGGMGTIYKAVRKDVELIGALKVLNRRENISSDDSQAAITQKEEKILARLEHENIARLYDADRSPDGYSYFFMEFVDGSSILDYCNENELSIESRLVLFQQVCHGVQAAHGELIVHADLKPSNVLVNSKGAVKLLDFGIATLLSDALGKTSESHSAQALTPQYAAPEQLDKSSSISTRTDIYGLGLLLYELLVGSKPYNVPNSIEEARKIVLGEKASSLSDKIDDLSKQELNTISAQRGLPPSRLQTKLAGDLSSICQKALDKNSENRYASAEAMAQDVQFYLDHRPLRAFRGSRTSTIKKWVRRNRLASAFILALTTLSSLLFWQGNLLTEQRDEAVNQEEKASNMSDLLVGLFAATNPDNTSGIADTLRARTILDRGASSLVNLEDQPELKADFEGVLGKVYLRLGDFSTSDSLLNSSLRSQIQLHGSNSLKTAEVKSDLAVLKWREGSYDDAIDLNLEAIPIFENERGPENVATLAILNNLATVYDERGDLVKAESLHVQVLERRRQILPEGDAGIIESLNNLTVAKFKLGKYGGMAETYAEVIKLMKLSSREETTDMATALNNLASYYTMADELIKAESIFRDALRMRINLLGEHHPETVLLRNNLAVNLEKQNRLDEAEEIHVEVLDWGLRELGEEHLDVMKSMNNLGKVLGKKGSYEEAKEFHKRAIRLAKTHLPDNHHELATFLKNLGEDLEGLDNPREAKSTYTEALQIIESQLQENHPHVVFIKERLSVLEND